MAVEQASNKTARNRMSAYVGGRSTGQLVAAEAFDRVIGFIHGLGKSKR